jgi:hypothetical protein
MVNIIGFPPNGPESKIKDLETFGLFYDESTA